MSPITHAELSWLVANGWALERRDRLFIFLAGVIPDLDGLGLFVSLESYAAYHHVLLHNILSATLFALISGAFSCRKVTTGLLAFAAFQLHLGSDFLGSGPGWGMQYLWPFSRREWFFAYQWDLASWQNYAVTLVALALSFQVAKSRGRTPLEFLSLRADARLVETISRRWPFRVNPSG